MLDWFPGLDQAAGTVTLPLWAAGAAAILFLVSLSLALGRAGAGAMIRATARVAVIAIIAAAGWVFVTQSGLRERDAERRALDARASELTARAVTPGSPLACLDAIAGEIVENACESALFASAETTSAALSYITARLTLLVDAISYASQRDPSYEFVLSDWRRALESDRFGLVAQVIAVRDGCGTDQCPTLGLLRDTTRVSANLKERTFDQHVARYAAGWGTRTGTPVAAAMPPVAPTATAPSAPSLAASSTSGPIFPSAASIPPVSIMNAEPTGSVQQGQTAPASTTAATEPIVNPPTPPRRPPPPPRRPPEAAVPAPPPSASAPPNAQ
jgi:hypothetical protein